MTKKERIVPVSIILLLALLGNPSYGQEFPTEDRPGWHSRDEVEIKGTLGYTNFLDNSPLYHSLIGGSIRFRIIGGLGVEQELTYLHHSEHDRDLLLVPNVIYEFRHIGRVVPYFIGGVGLMTHFEKWGPVSRSSNWRYATGGFGTKVFVSPKVFVAPEVRIGWEPSLRVSGTVGYVLRK